MSIAVYLEFTILYSSSNIAAYVLFLEILVEEVVETVNTDLIMVTFILRRLAPEILLCQSFENHLNIKMGI